MSHAKERFSFWIFLIWTDWRTIKSLSLRMRQIILQTNTNMIFHMNYISREIIGIL